jgi:hypothetical protein
VARRHGSRRDRRGALQQDPVRRRLAGGGGRQRGDGRRLPGIEAQRMLPFHDGEAAGDGEIVE